MLGHPGNGPGCFDRRPPMLQFALLFSWAGNRQPISRRGFNSWRGLSGCRARIRAGVGRLQQQLAFCCRGMPARMPSRQARMPTPRGALPRVFFEIPARFAMTLITQAHHGALAVGIVLPQTVRGQHSAALGRGTLRFCLSASMRHEKMRLGLARDPIDSNTCRPK